MSATLRAQTVVASVDETPGEQHLRRVVETQPVPLTRVAEDGTFLAVNDAALSMLGAERLDQVLETSLLDMVAPSSRDTCRVFLSRVAAGDRGSTEVEFTGLGGLAHTLQLHATSHPTPIDGIVSVLCTFRDVTEYRRLERAVVESAAREEQVAATHAAEVARLSTQLAETHKNASARSGDQARASALEQQLAEAERKHHEAAERHAVMQAQVRAEVLAAQQQLEATIADHLARITEVEESLRAAEGRERHLLHQQGQHEQGWQQSVAEHERQSAELRAAIDGLELALTAAKTREHELLEAQNAHEERWQRTMVEAVASHERHADDLRASLAAVEQQLAEAKAREDALGQRHAAAASEWQARSAAEATAHEAQLGELRAAIVGLETSVSALNQELETAVAERAALLAEHTTALTNLDSLARERDHASQTHAALEVEHEKARQAWEAEHQAARQAWELEHEAARSQWAAEHEQLQQKWTREHDEAQARFASEQEAFTLHRAELEAQLQVLEQQVEYLSAEHSVQTATIESDRAAHAEALAALGRERDDLTAQLALVGAERLAWSARLDHAERLARAGRLSLSFGDDIATALEGVAEYGRRLMADHEHQAIRPTIERMLAASTAAMALARQLRHDARTVDVDPVALADAVKDLEPMLGALLSPDIALAVLPGAAGALVALSAQQIEQVALTLAANRRATMMGGGQVSIELADVEIDEACARERAVSPGPYVLLAVHAAGPGVESGIAPALFGQPANEDLWQTAGPGMSSLFEMINEAGGYLWASQEGPEAIAFEVYLPRVGNDGDASGGARTR